MLHNKKYVNQTSNKAVKQHTNADVIITIVHLACRVWGGEGGGRYPSIAPCTNIYRAFCISRSYLAVIPNIHTHEAN